MYRTPQNRKDWYLPGKTIPRQPSARDIIPTVIQNNRIERWCPEQKDVHWRCFDLRNLHQSDWKLHYSDDGAVEHHPPPLSTIELIWDIWYLVAVHGDIQLMIWYVNDNGSSIHHHFIGGWGGGFILPWKEQEPLKCPIIGQYWVKLLNMWVYIAIFVSALAADVGVINWYLYRNCGWYCIAMYSLFRLVVVCRWRSSCVWNGTKINFNSKGGDKSKNS